METKWLAIGVIGVITAMMSPVMIGFYNDAQAEIAYAKAGLEECPKEIGSSSTLWTKDCSKYLSTLNTLKETDEK